MVENPASADDLQALANLVSELECAAPIYDYFHVNEIPEGEDPMNIFESAGTQVPFTICVGAGETLDLEFQLATKNFQGNDGEFATALVQLTAGDTVVAESASSSSKSSTTLFFRGKVMEDT